MTATNTVLTVGATLLGAIVGSFLNVVIHRLPRGTFFSDGSRSICANPECRQPIPWFCNLPIVGWLALRGRARCCGARISVRYPLVETLTATLFLLLWLFPPFAPAVVDGNLEVSGLLGFLFLAFFVANLIAGSFIDIDHRILPDVLTKSAMAVGLVGAMVVPGLAGRFGLRGLPAAADSVLFSAVGLLAGFVLTQSVRVLAARLFRREAMGFGDVKLMAGIGAFLGWQGVLITFFAGCVLGALVGALHRWLTRDAYICFGPFLALGALVSLFLGEQVVSLFRAWQDWQQSSPQAPMIALVGAVISAVLLVFLVRRGRRS